MASDGVIDITGITIRAATLADAEAIASLHASSWRETYRDVLSEHFLAHEVTENRRRLWQERLRQPADDQRAFVARHGDELCGFACVFLDRDPVHGVLLDNLHVRPGLTGQGIGGRLLTEVRALTSRERPGHTLHLWVFATNLRARRFDERCGGVAVEQQVVEVLPGVLVEEVRYVWRQTHRFR